MIRQERQCNQVIEYLNEHGSMTQRDADRIGIKRLASRVCDLNKMGRGIRSERIRVTNADGSHSYVAKYSLKKGDASQWDIHSNRQSKDTSASLTQKPMNCATGSRASVAATSSKKSGVAKTEMTSKTMQSHSMTFEWASKLVTKLLSATPEQKAQAVLYLNIFDYIELKEICDRSLFSGDKFCGIEVKTRSECPKNKYYIIRKNNNDI